MELTIPFSSETEEANKYWADVHSLFQQMDYNTCKYPLPMCFNDMDERAALLKRERRLKAIAERYIKMKYYKNS